MDLDDKKCICLYLKGEENALEPLIDKYKKPLYSFIFKISEGKEDADEVFQEVWFRVIKNIKKFKDGNFLSWMFRITHNLLIDRARKNWRSLSLNKEVNGESEITYVDQIISKDINPSDEVYSKEIGIKIKESIMSLSIEQKEVFILRMFENMSFKEISKIQKCSINTCLARMQYALNKMKILLKDEFKTL